MVIQDGVDLEKFHRTKNARILDNSNKEMVVGWVGNSEWGMVEDGLDHKGFNSIIKPVIEDLKNQGYNIKLKYADGAEPKTKIPHEKMIDFYNSIHIYLCLSDIEGTPNTVLEAMACGLAVVSTNVGIVSEAFGKEQKDYILQNRSKDALKKKLIELCNNPTKIKQLGEENLIRVSNWTWEDKCDLFELFFSTSIAIGPKVKYEIEDKDNLKNVVQNEKETVKANRYNYELSKLTAENEDITKKLNELHDWYNHEYEVLPLWFKRLGHIVKIITGKRKLFKK